MSWLAKIGNAEVPRLSSQEGEYELRHIVGYLSTVAKTNSLSKGYLHLLFNVSDHAARQFMNHVNTSGVWAASYDIGNRWFNTEINPDNSVFKGNFGVPELADALWTIEKARGDKREFYWAISGESAGTAAKIIAGMFEAGAMHIADINQMYLKLDKLEEVSERMRRNAKIRHFEGVWFDPSPELEKECEADVERVRDFRKALEENFGQTLKMVARKLAGRELEVS